MIKVDWDKLILKAIPAFLRRTRRYDWLVVLTSQTRAVNAEFDIYSEAIKRKLLHNGQVIYLEKVLNDIFDADQRRIQITDGEWANEVFIYHGYENRGDYNVYYAWENGTNYQNSDQVSHELGNYEALQNSPVETPSVSSSQWGGIGQVQLIKASPEYALGARFYVKYPSTLNINQVELNAVIRYFRSAPMTWKIILS